MKKKSLIMLVCAALVLTSVAFGTIAYLTSQDEITNTFTMGKVNITVDETEVDENGEPVVDDEGNTERTDEGNDYTLVPGKDYTKDPTVTVKAGSEDSYVRMLLTYNKAAALKAIFPAGDPYFVEDLNEDFWKLTDTIEDSVNDTITFVFNYYDAENENSVVAGAAADYQLPALFTTIEVPGTVTGEELETLAGLTMNAKAQAIQVYSFEEDEAAAWAMFEAQIGA